MILYKVQFETQASVLYGDRRAAIHAMIRYAAATNMVSCVVKYVSLADDEPLQIDEIIDFAYDDENGNDYRIFAKMARDGTRGEDIDPESMMDTLHFTRIRSEVR